MCIRDRYGDVGSVALAKRPLQLRPADSVTLLALDDPDTGNSGSWRVLNSAEGRRAEWAVAVHWKTVPGGELLSFRSRRWLRYDQLGLLALSSKGLMAPSSQGENLSLIHISEPTRLALI
eukprot:4534685-Alexandrium_andersonii.AAC.1